MRKIFFVKSIKNTNQVQNSIKTGFSESSGPILSDTIKKIGGSDFDHYGFDHTRVPVNLIHALPASKVKTITYPGAETDSMTSRDFLPVPETIFVCNTLLAENLEKFIDAAKVRF